MEVFQVHYTQTTNKISRIRNTIVVSLPLLSQSIPGTGTTLLHPSPLELEALQISPPASELEWITAVVWQFLLNLNQMF